MNYSTSEAKIIFNRDEQTIRNWAIEFADFLSGLANPEKGRSRQFTEEDMSVLDLVANLKDEGKQYIDIHAALKAGQRGNAPVISPEEIQALTVGQIERRMSLEIQRLQTEVTAAQEQLKELETVKAQNARLEERIELREEQVKSLTEQLEIAQNKLESLNREVGKAYLEGYKEALQSQNGKQDKD